MWRKLRLVIILLVRGPGPCAIGNIFTPGVADTMMAVAARTAELLTKYVVIQGGIQYSVWSASQERL